MDVIIANLNDTQTVLIDGHKAEGFNSPAIEAWLKANPARSMKIGLTGLKHMASLSEETHAFTATVTLDGVRAFEASNHGTGGPDSYWPVKGYEGPSEQEVDKWLRTNTPKTEAYGMELENSLEIVVGDLINDEICRKALKRMLNTKILVIDKNGDGEAALYTYKGKPTPENLASMQRWIDAGKVKGRLVNGGDDAIMAEAQKLV